MDSSKPHEVTMRGIGSIANELLHELTHRGTKAAIQEHPGRGLDVLNEGRGRLVVKRTDDHLDRLFERRETLWGEVQASYEKGSALCESPIERELLAGLLTGDWSFAGLESPPVHNCKNYDEPMPDAPVVIIPQMAVLRYRIDIGMVVKAGRFPRLYGIECDGADYHKDLDADRARDLYLSRAGVSVVRATGSDIYRWPISYADEIIMAVSFLMGK